MKGSLTIDPRGLIYESYRIKGISASQCRSIFLDWALGVPEGADMKENLNLLLATYRAGFEDHPMTKVIEDGLVSAGAPKRRRGRKSR